ncbi:DUF1842 domain-containing protein [Ascidiimonas aurantiaca]|uniref:DUF1842 domain-containing protein n=1 Tax=Ascidiimonas aurantiaca TaxID=1685432 RepID=UPI0030ECF57E
MSELKVGTFPVSYEVSTGALGAPNLKLDLIVTTPTKKVSGNASVTQAVNPPFEEHVPVTGNFTYMTVMPKNTHILVNVASPILVRDASVFAATLVLEDNWSSGVCNFTFLGPQGKWVEIRDAKVRQVELTEA